MDDPELTKEQVEILVHTRDRAPGGRFCGGGADMARLVELGLMKSIGRVSFCPDEFFVLTAQGKSRIQVMYSIYTHLFGVKFTKEENEKFQDHEVTEAILAFSGSKLAELLKKYNKGGEAPTQIECDVPYSGDGYADIHLGVYLGCVEPANRGKGIRAVTEEDKRVFLEFMRELKPIVEEKFKEWGEQVDDAEDTELLKEFLSCLDREPELYTGYSTS